MAAWRVTLRPKPRESRTHTTPARHPQEPRLRRCARDAARARPAVVAQARERGAAQARRLPTSVQLQAARRLQQDRALAGRSALARDHHRERGQPLPGRRFFRTEVWTSRGDRHAPDHAADQGGSGARDGGRGRAGWRQLYGRPGTLRRHGGRDRADVHPPLRRSARDRGTRDDWRRDPPPQPGSAFGGVRAGRRRRLDRRDCGIPESAAPPTSA